MSGVKDLIHGSLFNIYHLNGLNLSQNRPNSSIFRLAILYLS